MNLIFTLEKHIAVWLAAFIFSTSALLGALYYQYYLEWEPCVLCIQIRVIMAGIIVLSALMLLLHRYPIARFAGYTLQSVLAVLLFLKSRAIYRIEKGIDQAECMFNAGLPEWFNLEAWWPSLFEVRSACGDSPLLFLNLSMVDALYYASIAALPIVFILTLASFVALLTAKRRAHA